MFWTKRRISRYLPILQREEMALPLSVIGFSGWRNGAQGCSEDLGLENESRGLAVWYLQHPKLGTLRHR